MTLGADRSATWREAFSNARRSGLSYADSILAANRAERYAARAALQAGRWER